jgi:hypothetical protein
MTTKLTHFVLGGALLLGIQTLSAQEPPPGAPPSEDATVPPGPGPMGPRMELLGFGEMRPGRVVTGAPYAAVAVSETKQTLADGNVIDRKVQSNVYRDSQGRTRRELTFNGFGGLAATGQPRSVVMIHDPVAGAAYILHPDKKTAEQLPGRPGGKGKGPLQNKFQSRVQQESADGTLKKDDLGTQTINGINAQGTRYTRTIAAGQMGNTNPITITNEQWYSPDLQVVVKSTRNDPRFGETTYSLTNIQRSEPAASLFSVPSDYTTTQAKGRFRGRQGAGGSAPADAPPPPPSE